ncbi:MAG: LppX_LprAFG lipoprotein [Actinomycetia bacterium]|nr:LppX_LprAFG lipoprotein [Actinomycetes bacterium]
MTKRLQRSLASAAVIAVALVASFALGGLAACGGTDEDVDPQAVLAAASAKMKEIKGFHFVYEVHKPESAKPSAGLEIARMIGDINAAGDMKSTVDATYGGLPVTVGIVVLGDTYYIQDPISQKWTSVAAADSPVGQLSLSAGTIRILDRITDVSYEGQEDKGGVKTHHITGRVADEEVKAIAGLVDLGVTESFPTDIWIGVEDSLVYEVDIAGAATTNEDSKVWRSIVLSNLDTHVDVEAPQ